jgi:hypothetical protein
MIGFIGTSLQLQPIITAHTLNEICLKNLYEESLSNETSWTELTSMWTDHQV